LSGLPASLRVICIPGLNAAAVKVQWVSGNGVLCGKCFPGSRCNGSRACRRDPAPHSRPKLRVRMEHCRLQSGVASGRRLPFRAEHTGSRSNSRFAGQWNEVQCRVMVVVSDTEPDEQDARSPPNAWVSRNRHKGVPERPRAFRQSAPHPGPDRSVGPR
jgi:hypothetical protein